MIRFTLTTLAFIWSFSVYGQSCHESGPEVHGMAPIGVMGGHTHSKGHWMASYRFMPMNMSGLSSQSQNLSTEDVLDQHMMAPIRMSMNMHMLGVMYALHDKLTLSLMSSYTGRKMEMLHKVEHSGSHHHDTMNMGSMNETATMENTGLGDTKVLGLLRLTESAVNCLHVIGGLQMPTGSITQRNASGALLPYPMQNGLGSFSAIGGFNYSWLQRTFLLGGQLMSIVPLHENNRGYTAPKQYSMSVWGSLKLSQKTSLSLRLLANSRSAIDGKDSELNPMMSPLANPANTELINLNAIIGANFLQSAKWRLGLEAGTPLYQHFEGTGMNTSWFATIGLQRMVL